MWWLPLKKKKSGDFSTMGIHLYPSLLLSTNSIFPNHLTQLEQITPLLKVLVPLIPDKKVKGIGYKILSDKGQGKTEVFICILGTKMSNHGGLLHKISLTTSP